MSSSTDALPTVYSFTNTLKSKLFLHYLFAVLVSLGIFVLITHAWHLTLSIPFFYSGDSLFSSMLIKSVVDTGWYTVNPYIGAPDGFNLGDFPLNADNFHFLMIKTLTYFTHDYAIIFNIFYLLTFPITTLAALFVFKRLNLGYSFALVASLLFTFLPYHFFKGEAGHLFLASYFIVPLVIWLCVSLTKQRLPLTVSTLLCLLIGSTGIYYAFFALFFLLTSGLLISIGNMKLSSLGRAIFLCSLIITTIILNLLPSIHHQIHYGTNKEVAARAPFETDLYGLKIIQLLLPIDNDRLPTMAKFKEKYNSSAMLVNTENGSTTLGIIGAIGFILLLGIGIVGKPFSLEMDIFSKLTLSATLLATVGGLGSFLAYISSPMIRCYSRISVFIAFFSIYAFFYSLQKILQRYAISQNKVFITCIALSLLIGGVLNQTTQYFANLQNSSIRAQYANDRDFTLAIKKRMPSDSMIYQLPYMAFPEHGPLVSMADYEPLRPYLHSSHLKWSYAAIKGRPLAEWQNNISTLSTAEMLKGLVYMGYNGIYINRNGYSDHGLSIEKQITDLTHTQAMVSNDNHLSFFDLNPYINKMKNAQPISEWNDHHIKTLTPLNLSLSWESGFYDLEGNNDQQWRWSDKKSILKITNYLNEPIKLTLRFKALTATNDFTNLIIENTSFKSLLKLNSEGVSYIKTILVDPGINILTFYSNSQRVFAPNDPRHLYFRIQDFRFQIE